jgi:predicted ABC-type ATPase
MPDAGGLPLAEAKPLVVVIAGPNGAGKSTTAASVLQGALAVHEFVNADVIAQGLSAFQPETVAVAAGRIMLERLRELARQRASFAFETTLASRSFAPWLRELRADGYRVHLVFVSLPDPEMAISRVRDRVHRGGHHVPDELVRRRYVGGLRNFYLLYLPIADSWQMYDNGRKAGPRLVAELRTGAASATISNAELWSALLERAQ